MAQDLNTAITLDFNMTIPDSYLKFWTFKTFLTGQICVHIYLFFFLLFSLQNSWKASEKISCVKALPFVFELS